MKLCLREVVRVSTASGSDRIGLDRLNKQFRSSVLA